jgi:hypothetical protein
MYGVSQTQHETVKRRTLNEPLPFVPRDACVMVGMAIFTGSGVSETAALARFVPCRTAVSIAQLRGHGWTRKGMYRRLEKSALTDEVPSCESWLISKSAWVDDCMPR